MGFLPELRIVVLAAGFSARLGKPKALARVHGLSLLRRTLRVLAPLATSKIIVVIPRGAGRYKIGSPGRAVVFVANPHRAIGLSSSVSLGVAQARYSAAVLLLPVDLAELQRRDITRLIARWRGARRKVVAQRVPAGAAVPLILPRWLYPRTSRTGPRPGPGADHGLRDLVRRLPNHMVSLVRLPSAEPDVDTASDLERARRRIRLYPV